MQFLPLPLRYNVASSWPLGHTWGWPDGQTLQEVMSTELLTATEMRSYFPDGKRYWERFLGLPKSMLLVRYGFVHASARHRSPDWSLKILLK
jgi:hypothetical protein